MSKLIKAAKNLFKPKQLKIEFAPPDPKNAEEEVVFAGHGSYNPEVDGNSNGGKVRLPQNITLYFWCRHGEELIDTVGAYIESHKDIRQLPKHLLKVVKQGGYSTDIPEIVHGGEEIWNYRLTYPSGLKLGAKSASGGASRYTGASGIKGSISHSEPIGVIGDRRYVVLPPMDGKLHIAERGVPIIALLAAHWNICNGATIHWCACRSIRTDRGSAPKNPKI